MVYSNTEARGLQLNLGKGKNGGERRHASAQFKSHEYKGSLLRSCLIAHFLADNLCGLKSKYSYYFYTFG